MSEPAIVIEEAAAQAEGCPELPFFSQQFPHNRQMFAGAIREREAGWETQHSLSGQPASTPVLPASTPGLLASTSVLLARGGRGPLKPRTTSETRGEWLVASSRSATREP